ncbi:alpha-tocopherol transfer protein-like isoform X1 [Dinothrombium tinctorium]|uniref:Alpha-tocopherol transfer protein-like isoform X1 n=1 Tax=Dinothrombium tinctorium TaxID=1965070 RepID=A0A3S3RYI1_9ACAR|nr:alpha-tocopherol transfer protein-like isoform X1 [Dinothrombium tinctorium]RWS10569.1 alpha-tocopherol transfer protein-like isoform X1 [Dinothrombium tinctorium]RWS11834.1 alpha-tocopherol transfer protein-like isoform X1 [Dinothrombium tinctorium]
MYVQMFNKHPEFFTGVDFVREAIKTGTFQIFPERNVTGETIANMKPGNWNPDEVSFEAMMVSTIYAFEVDKLQEESQIYPTIEIIDCKNLSLKQVMKVGLSEIRLGAEMTEHTLPIRWRKLFIVNENYLIDILYNMAKMFLSKEFRERLAFIGNNFTELHKMVPPHLLPPEYGGTSGKCDIDRFLERIEKMEEQLMKLWEPFKKQKISI